MLARLAFVGGRLAFVPGLPGSWREREIEREREGGRERKREMRAPACARARATEEREVR
jgi:hypothetical protein